MATRFKGELNAAIRNGQVDLVKFCLVNGADVNARDLDGQTPLHWAVVSRNGIKIAQILLEHGADPTIRKNEDNTPLDDARRGGNAQLVELLDTAANRRQSDHAGRVTGERKDKGPPQVGG